MHALQDYANPELTSKEDIKQAFIKTSLVFGRVCISRCAAESV